ncbi:hypothetical protein B0J12DRAFT_702360 [Macrophomina phaseolina]|uniref:F-box domain cyclin-like protein n=1 Tax=Macrophomina phaseolina TaxID=35725 RepID=A0ABQ8G2C2_9PEZI|nr:hypothetical protein B0J12DRAFT_702360 [Macrophomina phaseolina]
MARPSFGDLPEELLEKVARSLDPSIIRQHTRDGSAKARSGALPILNFCLVSRKFFKVGKPFLHSVFVNDNDPVGLRNFVARACRNPDRMAYLRAICAGEFKCDSAVSEDADADNDLKEIWSRQLQQLNVVNDRDREAWLRDLQRCDYDAQLALILALAPNLEFLDLTYGSFGSNGIYLFWTRRLIAWAVQQSPAAGERTPLSALHHFIFREPTDITYPGDHCFWETAMLPSLRTLELHHLSEARAGLPTWIDNISAVETLTFRPRTARLGWLFQPVLRASRPLKSLRFILDRVGDDGDEAHGPSGAAGYLHPPAMQLHALTLTDLALECELPPDACPPLAPLLDLKLFARLKRLRISAAYLLPRFEGPQPADAEAGSRRREVARWNEAERHFPSSLELFALDCLAVRPQQWHWFIALLLDMGRSRDAHFPSLRTVEAVVPSLLWTGEYEGPGKVEPFASVASAMLDSSGVAEVVVRVTDGITWRGNCNTHHFTKES